MKFVLGSLLTLLHAHKPETCTSADAVMASKVISRFTVHNPRLKNARHIIHSFELNDSLGFQADVGILSHTRTSFLPANGHRRLQTCPSNCTNEALCNCMTDYDKANKEGQETCAYTIAKSCESPEEVNLCTPDEYFLAAANYFYCPLFTCLNSNGIGYANNDTEAYFKCQCDAQTNLCEECSRLEDSVPYCYAFMSDYSELCAELIPCCATETTIEGLQTCRDIWCDCDDTSTSVTASIGDIANELSPSESTKEESSDAALSAEQSSDGWRKVAVAASVLYWFV